MEIRDIISLIGLFVNILLPVVLVFMGLRINKSIKQIEHSHWANQKVIEKKLQLYDNIAPKLNDLYCFYLFVGHWKDVSPEDVIRIKRELDRLVYTYRTILGEEFVAQYRRFMDEIAFHVFNRAGDNARIIAEICNELGDRRIHAQYEWQDKWNEAFYEDKNFNRNAFINEFFAVMEQFQESIGLAIRKS
ncbi:MAG: hypothetical protein H6696_04710 [Deferribacteres bacterium]|nr:hypothetical protein [candidate division KSB1 bacterium]MCB9501217.1 hypothetical protein [Deferribacteres bacterium]